MSGVAGAGGQALVSPASVVPMIGASGAISGVLAAYLLLFPHATVLALLAAGFSIRLVHVPALIVLGLWIVLQIVNGVLSVDLAAGSGEAGGSAVAWFAHVAGVVGGMALLLALRPPARRAR